MNEQTMTQAVKPTPWGKYALIGGVAVGGIWLLARQSSKSTQMTEADRKMHESIINHKLPAVVIPKETTHLEGVVKTDSFVDYDSCAAATAQAIKVMKDSNTTMLNSLKGISTEDMQFLIFALANEGVDSIELMDLYVKLVTTWMTINKPIFDNLKDVTAASLSLYNKATSLSLQPSEFMILKDVTETADNSETITTTTRKSNSSAGLLAVGNFALLGGTTHRDNTQTTHDYIRRTSRHVIPVPVVSHYDVDPKIYSNCMNQVVGLHSLAMEGFTQLMSHCPDMHAFIAQAKASRNGAVPAKETALPKPKEV